VTLSILCITRAESHAWPFLAEMQALAVRIGARFVVVADGAEAAHALLSSSISPTVTGIAQSEGYLESILDEGVALCPPGYVLRLDDDERCSPAMVSWLASGAWTSEPAWAFATAGLWGDDQSVIVTPELWPQYHTRLTVKERAGGRRRIHAPDPHGRGAVAPVVLEHHKFRVKSQAERLAIADRYHQIRPGAGKRCHSVPELFYRELPLAPLGDGTLVAWADHEIRRIRPEVPA
jgi:hypothetical protein